LFRVHALEDEEATPLARADISAARSHIQDMNRAFCTPAKTEGRLAGMAT
jgi:hypothetical protein